VAANERKPGGSDGTAPKRLSALDRAIQTAMGTGRALGREDDPFRLAYPSVWDWLTRIYVGTNQVRTPATISVRLGPEGALVSMRDVDLGVSVSAACPNLNDVFAALEAALTADVPAIQSWGRKEPRLRKRGS